MTDIAEDEGTTTHVVHFTVEGKFIADLARTRVEEGAWDRALHLLTASFEGLSTDDAIAILKGEADLSGCSSDPRGVGLVRLKPTGALAKRMNARLDYLYGDVFRYEEKYWKPYARVLGWCEADYQFSRRFDGVCRMVDVSRRASSLSYYRPNTYRSLFYARDARRDLMVVFDLSATEQVEVLCEQTDMPPHWYPVPTNRPAEFLRQRLQDGLRLPLRGASQYVSSAEVAASPEVLPGAANGEPTVDEEDRPQPAQPAPVPDEPQAARTREANTKARRAAQAAKAARSALTDFAQGLDAASDYAQLGAVRQRFSLAFPERDSNLPLELYDLRDELLERARLMRHRMLGDMVKRQADESGGWFELPLFVNYDEPYARQRSLRVPRNPFLLWALRGFDFEANGKERPAWTQVCPCGMKMLFDDAMHSDWMLGAGVALDDAYNREQGSFADIVQSSAFSERMRLVQEWTGATFVTLAKGPGLYVSGTVVHPGQNEPVEPGSIAVVPHAGPEYQLAMESACRSKEGAKGALICETGGKLAHLSIVGRELGCTVLMLPEALKRFRPGTRLSIDLREGRLHQNL